MSRPFKPHEYQKIATEFLLATPRAALYADMGMGKTGATLAAIECMHFVGLQEPPLVLAPLRVAQDTWPDEVAKWDETKHLRIVPITGDPTQRRAALRKSADIYTCNYDQLVWLVDWIGADKWPFKLVVADESPRLKGYRTKQGGQRAQALASVARHTDYWFNLSGTPVPNGYKDLWGQYWFLDFGERLGKTYSAFEDRWFRQKKNGYGIEPMPFSIDQINERVKDITMSIRARDWFDLHEPLVQQIRVKLPPNLRKQYRSLEKDLFAELESGHRIEVFNAGAKCNKCLQFANGAVYTEHPAWASVHDLKLQALESIVNEAGGAQIMVSYEFQSDKARILAAFKQAVDISTPKGLQAFKAGEKQIGVAHPGSMGHGIDGLQENCWMLVYFGYTWKLDYHQQILERIGPMRQFQSGHHDRLVRVWMIVTEGTLDDTVIERHASKRDVQDLLMEYMNRRQS